MTSAECVKLESDDDEGVIETALQALRERRGRLFDSVNDIRGTALYKQICHAVHRLLFIIGDVPCETFITELGLKNVLQRHCGPKDVLNMQHLVNILLTWINHNPNSTGAMFFGHVKIIESSLTLVKQEKGQECLVSPRSTASSPRSIALSPLSTASSPRSNPGSPRQETDLLSKETNDIAKKIYQKVEELLDISKERQQNRNISSNA